jgi:superfamily I DNA/RNA helicase
MQSYIAESAPCAGRPVATFPLGVYCTASRGSFKVGAMTESVEDQFKAAVDAVIHSAAVKKIVVAGPGAGKTWLFRKLLETCPGDPDERLILTFINNLKNDLERDLGDLAQVYTFHGYCRRLLHQNASLRAGLTEHFHYFPSLASLIKEDWELAKKRKAPHFVGMMRELTEGESVSFYVSRSDYYNAVAFDDSVFRVLKGFQAYPRSIEHYHLLLVDEYQDFNRLESSLIDCLAKENPTVIAGDDDQALYSQLKSSRPEFILPCTAEMNMNHFLYRSVCAVLSRLWRQCPISF